MSTNRAAGIIHAHRVSLEQEGSGTHDLQLDQVTMENLCHLFQVSHSVINVVTELNTKFCNQFFEG